MLLAGAGFLLSAGSHAAALLGQEDPLGGYAWLLHVGIFVVWLPVVFVSRSLTRGTTRWFSWNVALRGAPDWMRYVLYALFVYAFVNFFRSQPDGEHGMSPNTLRLFSGHWMLFYGAAFVVMYSAINVERGSSDIPTQSPPGTMRREE